MIILGEVCIHKIYPVLLKRLDDGYDDVRLIALEVLTEVWSAIPKDYDLKGVLKTGSTRPFGDAILSMSSAFRKRITKGWQTRLRNYQ